MKKRLFLIITCAFVIMCFMSAGAFAEQSKTDASTESNTPVAVAQAEGGQQTDDGQTTESPPAENPSTATQLLASTPVTALAEGESTNTATEKQVSNESELRKALYNAPTDGTEITIKLTADITLEMYYSSLLFPHSNETGTWKNAGYTDDAAKAEANKPENGKVADNNTQYNTLNHYKIAVNGWNTVNKDITEKAKFGANYPGGATNPVARLVVKSGQNVIIDLNGHTITKRADATHGSWGETDTDIIGNYGILTVTDNSDTEQKGTIKGLGYNSCSGAVLHNYSGATMVIGAVNVDGNAKGMSAGTGQYLISNEGGTVTIDDTNIYDPQATSTKNASAASLLKNKAGDVTIKGDAVLNHPDSKVLNIDNGNITIESATIISDDKAIKIEGGIVNITGNITIKASSAAKTAGTMALEKNGAITKAKNVELSAPSGTKWVEIGNKYVLVKDSSVAVLNNIGYDSLTDAINSATAGQTIELLKNLTVADDTKANTNGIITITKNLVIDGNGYTITFAQTTDTSKEASGINITNGAKVTLKDITLDANKTAKHGINIFGGDVKIENVTIKNFSGYGVVVQGKAVATKLTTVECGWGGVNVDVNGYDNNAEFTFNSGNVGSIVVENTKVKGNSAIQLTSKAAIVGGTVGGACLYNGTEAVDKLTGASLIITGGTFSSDPSAYLADGYEATQGTDGKYTVGLKNPEKVVDSVNSKLETKTQQGDAVVNVGDGVSAKDVATAETIAKNVKADLNKPETTKEITVSNDDKKTAVDKLVAAGQVKINENGDVVSASDGAVTITIIEEPYLEVDVTEIKTDKDTGKKELKLDITPKYNLLATTATGEAIANAEKVTVSTGNALNVEAKTDVKLQLPEGFAKAGDKLLVTHTKHDGSVEYLTGKVTKEGGVLYVSFTTTGFSPIVVSDNYSATNGEQVYPTLQSAIDAAKDGDVIKLMKDGETAVVKRTVSFKVDPSYEKDGNKGNYTYTITLGDGTTRNKTDNDNEWSTVYTAPAKADTAKAGTAKTAKAPATGDNSELGLFAVAGLTSAVGVAPLLRRKQSM